MKRKILTAIVAVLIAYSGALSLASCGSKDKTEPEVVSASTASAVVTQDTRETVAVVVTDANGTVVTNKNGEAQTTYVYKDDVNKTSKTKKTKKTKTTKVQGGTDPYVQDIFD